MSAESNARVINTYVLYIMIMLMYWASGLLVPRRNCVK